MLLVSINKWYWEWDEDNLFFKAEVRSAEISSKCRCYSYSCFLAYFMLFYIFQKSKECGGPVKTGLYVFFSP